LPQISETLPEVKERPKVAKRPTTQPAEPAAPKRNFKVIEFPASSGLAERRAEERTLMALQNIVSASTIPPVKDRPKVAGRSTLAVIGTQPAAQAKVEPKIAPAQPSSWIYWAPVAIGIALGFMAPQLHARAAQWGPWGLRILFPIVQVAGLHAIGMSGELTRMLPRLLLYLQFPLEGLLVASNLRRGVKLAAAVRPVPALHFVCGLVLWIVALGSSWGI
jgi:hypothetical protein